MFLPMEEKRKMISLGKKLETEASEAVSATECAFALNVCMVHIHAKKEDNLLAAKPSNMCGTCC